MSADADVNYDFIEKWHGFIGNEERVTNDPMEAHYIGFNMWIEAVEKAGTTDVDAVREAMYGLTYPNLTGGTAVMNTNHHLTKPVLIGEIQADGQFETVWQTLVESLEMHGQTFYRTASQLSLTGRLNFMWKLQHQYW